MHLFMHAIGFDGCIGITFFLQSIFGEFQSLNDYIHVGGAFGRARGDGFHRRAEGGHPWVYSNEVVMDAAAKQDKGIDVRTEASMIKVYSTELAAETIDHAMQAYGAMGVTKELPLQLMAAKVRTMRVYEGPSEVHRAAIARRIIDARK